MTALFEPHFTLDELRVLARAVRHYQQCHRVEKTISEGALDAVARKLLDCFGANMDRPYGTAILLQKNEPGKD